MPLYDLAFMTRCRLLPGSVCAKMYANCIGYCCSWAVMPDIGTGAVLDSAASIKRINSALTGPMYALNAYLN